MPANLVSLDWDGTLADPLTGLMYEGAPRFVERIQRLSGVYVCTLRASYPGGADKVEAELERNRLKNVTVTNRKPDAWCYVDDRAVAFDGDYEKAFREVRRFINV